MIHVQTKAESYKFFGSWLVSLDDELSNILVIGFDRDTASRKDFHLFFSQSLLSFVAKVTWSKIFDVRRRIRELACFTGASRFQPTVTVQTATFNQPCLQMPVGSSQ